MLNIFNLFLFLFALWIVLIVTSNHISWLYVFFGFIAAGLATLVSMRLKLLDKKSEMLFLSLGFYRHFLKVFIKSFFKSIAIIIDLALGKSHLVPAIYKIKINKEKTTPALLATSANMVCGLFTINLDEDEITIHALDEKYFRGFDLKKIYQSLSNVNDDNLV